MGVGIALGEQVHGVQVFGELTAELVAAPEEPVPFGRTGVTFRFRYLGIRERDELSLFIKFADPRAKYFVDVNKYYIGMGPLIPEWGEDDLFTVSFDADKGRGSIKSSWGMTDGFIPGVSISGWSRRLRRTNAPIRCGFSLWLWPGRAGGPPPPSGSSSRSSPPPWVSLPEDRH